VAPLVDHGPLFAVTPPPPSPLFGAGVVQTAAAVEPIATAAAPAGGVATDGGWFSDAMLAGLRKYQAGSAGKPAATVDAVH
jgi:hypothetical protein